MDLLETLEKQKSDLTLKIRKIKWDLVDVAYQEGREAALNSNTVKIPYPHNHPWADSFLQGVVDQRNRNG